MDRNLSSLPRRIGVVDQSSTGWTAAGVYSRMTVRALAAVCEPGGWELYFLSSRNLDEMSWQFQAERIQLTSAPYLPGERRIRRSFGLDDKSHPLPGETRFRNLLHLRNSSDVFAVAREHHIDVLLPLLDVPPWLTASKLVGWIPDFQHVYLPEFFKQSEIQRRNATIRRLAERAALIMLSSNAAREDFLAVAPNQIGKARVVPFPSLLVFEPLPRDPISTRNNFNLRHKFALVANQFWAHKNHLAVVAALDRLKRRGIEIPVVMTGLPADYRDPTNSNLSSLLQAIAAAGLNGQITILGQVPFSDLISLMRVAAVIIQPSRFEGWSTVVQDSKALGRPLICSDIAVHREQAPKALGFFPCNDPEGLADLLASHWESLAAGPEPDVEAESLAREHEFARRHGEMLLRVCEEAMGTRR